VLDEVDAAMCAISDFDRATEKMRWRMTLDGAPLREVAAYVMDRERIRAKFVAEERARLEAA